MALYLRAAKELLTNFVDFKIAQVPRAFNARANALTKLGSTSSGNGPGPLYTDTLECPNISKPPDTIMQTKMPMLPCWLDPITLYLTQGTLPNNTAEARCLQRNSRHYLMIDSQLYQMSHSSSDVGHYLRCLRPSKASYVLREIHEGACGNHPGARTLAQKVIHQGHYWPTILAESRRLVSLCKKCQFYSSIPRATATELTLMLSLIPFA
ncbi:uncharacterized protein LOC109847393 [Asparagus officinalis]|uniref:uncharacterized protein LOC109847393 n=1 Tax=Asparagus officinalis TaxID=4686 RepID=UPI00098E65B3|nr:uncharacterized protein LOC109847393 [Asparagus officinalis]